MDIDRVDPSLRRAVQRVPRGNLPNPVARWLIRTAVRLMPVPRPPAGVQVREIRRGAVRYRLYLPERRTGRAMVWIHGGGMVMGSPRQSDRLCTQTAAELGMVIAAVHYRLAPEHPFPAPLDDCAAVWAEIVRETPWDIDPQRIAVGGQSAGAGLAAALCQRLLDDGGPQPVAQWLIYPMLDDRTAARVELDAIDHYMWNNPANRFGWQSLLAQPPGSDIVPPHAVPARRGDLAGLPPAWIGVGDIDLFHDEDVAYAERLRRAGVDTTLDVVPGAPHGFDTVGRDLPITQGFLGRGRAWLAAHT